VTIPAERSPSGIPANGNRGRGAPLSWREGALARGYSYRERWDAPPFPGLLFGADAVVATDVVDGTTSGTEFTAGSLSAEYVVGGGAVASSFIAVRLPRKMPDIVLVNARRGALRAANIGMGSRQMLSLAGSYDAWFTLYCPLGENRVATAIFTPELMDLFVSALPGGDIELFDDWMFIYDEPGRFASAAAFDRIDAVLLRVRDEVTKRDFAALHDTRAVPVVATAVPRMRGGQFAVVLAASAAAAVLVALWGVFGR